MDRYRLKSKDHKLIRGKPIEKLWIQQNVLLQSLEWNAKWDRRGYPKFSKKKKRELDKVWARVFYEANISFLVSMNTTFKETVTRRTKFCGGIYVPPSYHDLCKKFLVQAKEELQIHPQVKMVKSVHKFGTTLAVKWWSLVTNCPFFIAMLVSTATKQFLKVVDTIGYPKTTEYQASIMEKYIEEVGPQNVV